MIPRFFYLINIFIIFSQELVRSCLGDGSKEEYKTVSMDMDTYILLKNDIYFEIIEPQELSYTFKVHPAKNFGGKFETPYVHIGLVLAEPFHGCSSLYNSYNVKNNIVLVQRGECSFLSKAIQAEKCGALGVLITDNELYNDSKYVEMIEDNTNRKSNIPTAFLLGKDGQMIEEILRKKKLTHAVINIPVNLTNVPQHKQKQPPWLVW